MPMVSGHVDFNPAKDIPSLQGKVFLVTGGTAGLGRESVVALAQHQPEHIYFTGRNAKAAESLVAEVREKNGGKDVPMTFLEMDMTSLGSVKASLAKFVHPRLDMLMCNAGIMAKPPSLTKDGYELQFGVNHLAHAMIIQYLLPTLRATAARPASDVRVVCLSSEGWRSHMGRGILFDQLQTPMDMFMGKFFRYGQSKLANVVYARELAKLYPEIMFVSVHPGVVQTDLVNDQSFSLRMIVYISQWVQGEVLLTPEQGCLSQMWLAAGAKRDELVNGGLYYPIGVFNNKILDKTALDPKLATKLAEYTNEALAKF